MPHDAAFDHAKSMYDFLSDQDIDNEEAASVISYLMLLYMYQADLDIYSMQKLFLESTNDLNLNIMSIPKGTHRTKGGDA